MAKKVWWRLLATIGAIGLLGWGCLWLLDPFGIPEPHPWFSRPGADIVSPDGTVVLKVVFGDAGATHGGRHGTWIYHTSLIRGRRVVVWGFTDLEFTYGDKPLPVTWLDGKTFEIDFWDSGRGGKRERYTVRLD